MSFSSNVDEIDIDGFVFPKSISFAQSKSHTHVHVARWSIINTSTTVTFAFKLKTNAPTRYAVRPIYGKVLPGATQIVYVRCDDGSVLKTDRFMVQITSVKESTNHVIVDKHFWNSVDPFVIRVAFIKCAMDTANDETEHRLSISSTSSKDTFGTMRRTASIESSASNVQVQSHSETNTGLPSLTRHTVRTISTHMKTSSRNPTDLLLKDNHLRLRVMSAGDLRAEYDWGSLLVCAVLALILAILTRSQICDLIYFAYDGFLKLILT